MTETPIGKLKAALIGFLTKQIEGGEPTAAELAAAAKVVKDFHQEAGPTEGQRELADIVSGYRLQKAGQAPAAH